jgi:antitoxin component YwqK of YwqJK toxin-antitoxin module
MKNDRWHGTYEEWYENGSPKLSGQYMDGQQDGEWVFFDKEGNNLPNLNFENGIETTRKLPKLLGD